MAKRNGAKLIADNLRDMSLNPPENSRMYGLYDLEIDNYSEKRRALDIINADMPKGYALVMMPDDNSRDGKILLLQYDDKNGDKTATAANHRIPEEIPQAIMDLLHRAGLSAYDTGNDTGQLFHTMEKDTVDGITKYIKTLNVTLDNPDGIAVRLRGNKDYKETVATEPDVFDNIEAQMREMKYSELLKMSIDMKLHKKSMKKEIRELLNDPHPDQESENGNVGIFAKLRYRNK